MRSYLDLIKKLKKKRSENLSKLKLKLFLEKSFEIIKNLKNIKNKEFREKNIEKLRKINSDNFIILIYILIGLFLSGGIISILFLPTIRNNFLLSQEISVSKLKKSKLITLQKEFNLTLDKFKDLQNKRNLLIKLIAGTDNLNTFVALLNLLAVRNNINIVELEPIEIVEYKEKKKASNNFQTNLIPKNIQTPQISIDNKQLNLNNQELLEPEIEKHKIKIKLEGSFQQILEFIRDIESTENIVLIGDFTIDRLSDFFKEYNSNIKYETELSAFGRVEISDD